MSEQTQSPRQVLSFPTNEEYFSRSLRTESSTPPCCLSPMSSFELLSMTATSFSDLNVLLCTTLLFNNKEV